MASLVQPIIQPMKRLGLILFLFAVGVLTTLTYHWFNQEWVMFRRGEAHFSQEEFSEAIPYYEKLLRKGFQDPALLKHLGSCYLATGDPGKARVVFERLIAQRQDRLWAMKELAALYIGFDRFGEAAQLYRAILESDPKARSVRIRLARALSWSGRLEEAIHEYRKALGEER